MPSSARLQARMLALTGLPQSEVVRIRADDRVPLARGGYRQPAACRAFGSTGAFCLFAIAIGVILWIPYSPVAPVVPAAPLAVTFELAAVPFAPPSPPVDVPAGQVQQEQEASRAVEAKVEPSPVEPVLPAAPEPSAGAEQALPDSRSVERTTAPPAAMNPGATVAARLPSISAERAALANWQSQLLGHLKAYLRFPRQAERGRQEGVALVSVTVDRQGRVLRARIDRGSGYPLLDSEALATVRRGSPVPPPTADIRGDPVSVTIPVQFALRR